MTSTPESLSASTPGWAATLSLDNPRLFFGAVLLSIVPLWLGAYLPMVDLPGHAAVITALQQIAAGNSTFTESFETDWFTPYLLGYALFYLLASFLPISVTMKIVLSLSLIAVPILTGMLLRAAGADQRWQWLSIPGSYSFAFYWGFLSYVVAVPVALFLLVLTVRFERQTTLANGCIVAALTVFLFFSHVIAMGAACLAALVYLAAAQHRQATGVVRRLALLWLPYTAPIPLIGAWLIPRVANEVGVADAPVVYPPFGEKLAMLVAQPAGFEVFSPLALAVTAAIVLLPPLSGARLARSPARWAPFLVLLAVFLAVPSFAVQTGFMYERLGVFLVPLALLTWDPPAAARRVDWLAIPIVLLCILGNVVRFSSFAKETQSFDGVMEHMESGKRVASMIVQNGTPLFGTPVYLHFSSWYQARKLGVVDFNFADFRLVLSRRDVKEPRLGEALAWSPWLFEWDGNGGSTYDYFIVKASDDVSRDIFKEHLSSVRLVSQNGWWWLYENVSRRSDGE